MGALNGVVVIDAATLFAGPLAAAVLGDLGAEVIKIEHPKGDPVRTHGQQKNGIPLWWKLISRNKRAVTLNLNDAEAQQIFRHIVRKANIVIESFRPGTLERWNLGADTLLQENPGLILTRISGFGQFGPYKSRPGFGTLAEAMSGFAAMTGEPKGPPTLPPFGLADGITGLAAAIATLAALRVKEQTGKGQIVDVSLIEPILTILGAQPTWFDQLGFVQERSGNSSSNNAPRNTYKTRDGKWVAISTSAQNIAERVMRLVGHPEVIAEPWFGSGKERAKHAAELDAMVSRWIIERPLTEVIDAFEKSEAAVAPIYDIRDVMTDPQYRALNSIITVEDEDLGPLKMQNVMFRLSETPGRIRWAGRRKGQDNEAFYAEMLNFSSADLERLTAKGVI